MTFMKKKVCNLISIIKNGQLINKSVVICEKKKSCEMLLNVLWNEGYIFGYKKLAGKSCTVKIFLKYVNNCPVITNFKIISKPGLRIYYTLNQLWKINNTQGLLILSTNQGLLSAEDCKKIGIGGEPLLIIK